MTARSCALADVQSQTIGNQIETKMRTLASCGKPAIEIELGGSHGVHGKWVTSYSTMDTIKGTVSVVAPHDTPFEDIEIAFVGTIQVYVDRATPTPSITGRTEATHRFLTQKQPIENTEFPYPRKLLANKKYVFPFTFTVPAQLLPKACSHNVSSDAVRHNHLMLPPSMGDPDVAGFGTTLLDDLAPEMTKVVYMIRVRILQEGKSFPLLVEKTKKVRVKPAFEEQPPLTVSNDDAEYRLRHEKSIKKGLFKGKLGTLTAESAQPKPLVIPGARSTNNCRITTMAKLFLRFDPADESHDPPSLGSVKSKIKVTTYYASAPRKDFPIRSALAYDVAQGVYQTTLPLSTLCIASAKWTKHSSDSNPNPFPRRDSCLSDRSSLSHTSLSACNIPTPAQDYKGGIFYTAAILVPIALPLNKNFLPTFHSCLVSRVYVLSLQLSLSTPGSSAIVGSSTMSLRVPVQICAEGSDEGMANARVRAAEERVGEEMVEEEVFMRAMSLGLPPSVGGGGGVEEEPPEYGAVRSVGRYRTTVTVVT
ncbi:uncharacterized protein EI97DRAFT_374012 [Westerdykella ornata]|uniref:Arrestin-like N-terminal domain-containing protein n=1 Tax=Westerdykella ornata TaxID=318751 RepID=A0A6A6JMW8_WESOR|nr:uncharacterized protein EI97DRAFT_374012 [Westerdykella ornata]KAF2277867.1 hypothetical protein EI97DRAFT_374012 [Westerdykella ornata]